MEKISKMPVFYLYGARIYAGEPTNGVVRDVIQQHVASNSQRDVTQQDLLVAASGFTHIRLLKKFYCIVVRLKNYARRRAHTTRARENQAHPA